MRRALQIGGMALAGLAVAIVVALVCALWSPLKRTRALQEAEAVALITQHLGSGIKVGAPGGTHTSGPGWVLLTAADGSVHHEIPAGTGPRSGAPNAPRAAAPAAAPPAVPGGQRRPPRGTLFQQVPMHPDARSVHAYSAGWPLRCLSGERHQLAGTPHFVCFVEPPALLERLGSKPMRGIPYRPQWFGLAANSLFYAGVIWLLIPGPILLRRYLRRRRGHCPTCGYDLVHSEDGTCPECGARPAVEG